MPTLYMWLLLAVYLLVGFVFLNVLAFVGEVDRFDGWYVWLIVAIAWPMAVCAMVYWYCFVRKKWRII